MDGELDIPQPPGPELELSSGLAVGDVGDHATPHRLHICNEAVSFRRCPHHRLHRACVPLAKLAVSGDRARLEQRLELPGLGPPPVVADVTRQRPNQSPRAALRSKPRIDRPDRALRGVIRARAHHRGRELARHPQRCTLALRIERLGDEHDVDVAHVIELTPTALAQRDDCQSHIGGGLAELEPTDGEPRLQGRSGQIRQLGGNLVDRNVLAQIPGGEHQQPTPVGDAQGILGGLDQPGGLRELIARVGPHDRQQLGAHLFRGGTDRAQAGGTQVPPVIRMPIQMTSQRVAGAQDGEQAGAQHVVGLDRRHQLRQLIDGIRGRSQPGQVGQRDVCVGYRNQRREYVFGQIGER